MMRHEITHRFQPSFKVTFNCQICDRPILIGVKCKDCKYRCHKNCALRAPPSCGLPNELINVFAETIKDKPEDSPLKASRQDSVTTSKDWEISFKDLKCDKVLSNGKFGCDIVRIGNWHGLVIVKEMNIPQLVADDKDTRKLVEEIFKKEVSDFLKARHDNLEIFMGACMDYPRLAIVTNYCKGKTLYDQIHILKTRFNLNRIIHIAQQICLGMGFLHSRNIVHKDLTTKNIFFETGTVTITDFGLFPLKKLCRMERKGPWLPIPKGWLSYLAPEIMRKLDARTGSECNNINFTYSTDVYAFGTIWYELLTGDLPYKNLPPVITIWQVGRGLKQPLVNLQAPREIKNILLICWSADRPNFPDLNNLLEALPRKRVQRSSSFCIEGSKF